LLAITPLPTASSEYILANDYASDVYYHTELVSTDFSKLKEGDPPSAAGWTLVEAGAGESSQVVASVKGHYVKFLRLLGKGSKPATITHDILTFTGEDPAYYYIHIELVPSSIGADGRLMEVYLRGTGLRVSLWGDTVRLPDSTKMPWNYSMNKQLTLCIAYDPATKYFYFSVGDLTHVGKVSKGGSPTAIALRVYGEVFIHKVKIEGAPPIYWTPTVLKKISGNPLYMRVAASADAKIIVVADHRSVHAFDLKGRKLWVKRLLPEDEGERITVLEPSPVGNLFAVGTSGGKVFILNSAGDTNLLREYGNVSVNSISWYPAADRLIISRGTDVEAVKVSGERLWIVKGIGYVDEGLLMSDGSVAVRTHGKICTIRGGLLSWCKNLGVSDIDVSPNSPLIAAITYREGKTYVLSSSGEVIWSDDTSARGGTTSTSKGHGKFVAWSPDGELLVAQTDYVTAVYDKGGAFVSAYTALNRRSATWVSRRVRLQHYNYKLEAAMMMGTYSFIVASLTHEIGDIIDTYVADVWADPWKGLLLMTTYNDSGSYLIISIVSEPKVKGIPAFNGKLMVGRKIVFDASRMARLTDEDLTYCWSVGSSKPNCGSSPKVSVTLNQSGRFFGSLRILGSRGETIYYICMSLYVSKGTPPDAVYVVSSDEPMIGQQVIFNATLSSDEDGWIQGYIWDFGDGKTVNTTNPVVTHTYTEPGTYTVTLTVVDNDDLTSNTWGEITVTATGGWGTATEEPGETSKPSEENRPPSSDWGGAIPAVVVGAGAVAAMGFIAYLKFLARPKAPPPPPPPPPS